MKLDLHNAGGPDAGVQDVLGAGDVAVLAQPLNVRKEVTRTVGQLELVGPQVSRLNNQYCT